MKRLKKSNKKKKNISNKKRKKKLFKSLFLIVAIIIFAYIAYHFIFKRNNNNDNDNDNNKHIRLPDEIMYKGGWITRQQLFNDTLSKVSEVYHNYKEKEKQRYKKYYYLEEYNDDPITKNNLRNKLYEKISEIKKKNITKIDTFFLSRNNPFGNNLPCINNAIFYCEILGCNKIILREKKIRRRWLIKNITITNLNITITQGPDVNCNEEGMLCSYETWDLLYPILIKPEIRTQYVKDEILKNLPQVKTEPDDLYMHIRGGDIFTYLPLNVYSQPPLCFYEKVIQTNNFKNIYLISQDNLNVVVDALIKKYPKIIFNKNDFETDISLLAHAYHIACSIGSFVISAIKLNDNLKNIYEYDIVRLPEKIIWQHYHVFKFDIKYKIFTMNPSDEYASEMFYWAKSDKQKKLMLEDKCPYDFTITNPN